MNLRLGLRWAVIIELKQIKAIELITKKPVKAQDILNGMLLITPNMMITLHESVVVKGLYGIERKVSKLTLYIDNPEVIIDPWNKSKSPE